MDSDLQDRPEEIPRLFDVAAKEGFDIVQAHRAVRQVRISGFLHRARIGDRLCAGPVGRQFRYLPASRHPSDPCDPRALLLSPLSADGGFRLTSIDVEHGARRANRSSAELANITDASKDAQHPSPRLLRASRMSARHRATEVGDPPSHGGHSNLRQWKPFSLTFRIPRRSSTLGADHKKGG